MNTFLWMLVLAVVLFFAIMFNSMPILMVGAVPLTIWHFWLAYRETNPKHLKHQPWELD